MPVWTVYNTLQYWPFGDIACDVWNTLDYILCDVSIFSILAISIDRYMGARNPLTHRANATPSRCRKVLVLIWVANVLAFGTFIGTTQTYLRPKRDVNSNQCGIYYGTKLYLSIFSAIFSIWGPIFTTSVLYLYTLRIATASGQTKREVGPKDATIDKKQRALKATRDQKTTRVITLLLVVFSLCWLPISGVSLVKAVKPNALAKWMIYTVYWLGYINSTLNPLCYAIGYPRFRIAMLSACRAKTSTTAKINSPH